MKADLEKCSTLTLASLFLGAALHTAQAAAESVPDPEQWYLNSYAPLWNGTPAADIDKILDHYADEIVTHESDGAISRDDQDAWLAEPMAEWVEEGWLRAELTELDTHYINETTAAFVGTWTDYYDDGSTEVSCGWYLADFLDGEWIITEYADTDCS